MAPHPTQPWSGLAARTEACGSIPYGSGTDLTGQSLDVCHPTTDHCSCGSGANPKGAGPSKSDVLPGPSSTILSTFTLVRPSDLDGPGPWTGKWGMAFLIPRRFRPWRRRAGSEATPRSKDWNSKFKRVPTGSSNPKRRRGRGPGTYGGTGSGPDPNFTNP